MRYVDSNFEALRGGLMNLVEYTYIDENRLNSYVEQIRSPNTTDKVPNLKWSISLLGPAVEGSQASIIRLLTNSEKINTLLDYLKKHKSLGDGRFSGRNAFAPDANEFRLETCTAIKTFIPPVKPEVLAPDFSDWPEDYLPLIKDDPLESIRQRQRLHARERELARARETLAGFKGLSIWISDQHHAGLSNPEKRGQLYLVVGFPMDDVNNFGTRSAYSAFSGLMHELEDELSKSVLRDVLAQSNDPTSKFQKSFLANPINALRSYGAHVDAPRKITTLYRVRDAVLYKDPQKDEESIATIGYPIYIAAEGF